MNIINMINLFPKIILNFYLMFKNKNILISVDGIFEKLNYNKLKFIINIK
jgi:hypothetical protein